jgi:hypothetical protein
MGDRSHLGDDCTVENNSIYDDDLKKVFETYCSLGEPMNTKKLKSSKLMRMLKDAFLIKGLSKKQAGEKEKS